MISRKNCLKLGAMAGAGLAPPLGTLSINLLPLIPPLRDASPPAFRYVSYRRILSKDRGVGRGSVLVGRRSGAKEGSGADMICVIVEIPKGALTRRARVTVPSIERVPKIAGGGMPDHRTRLRCPIDSDALFVPEGSGRLGAA